MNRSCIGPWTSDHKKEAICRHSPRRDIVHDQDAVRRWIDHLRNRRSIIVPGRYRIMCGSNHRHHRHWVDRFFCLWWDRRWKMSYGQKGQRERKPSQGARSIICPSNVADELAPDALGERYQLYFNGYKIIWTIIICCRSRPDGPNGADRNPIPFYGTVFFPFKIWRSFLVGFLDRRGEPSMVQKSVPASIWC